MNQHEEWKPVVGFPDYEVSSLGRVLSHRSRKPRLLRLSGDTITGYPLVTLAVGTGGKANRKNFWLHHLIAAAFHGPRPDGMEIRHLDGNKLNNQADNLCYGTRSENVLDRVLHGTHYLASKTHCKRGHPFDEANTYRVPGRPRHRFCRTCRRDSNAARDQLRREASARVAA